MATEVSSQHQSPPSGSTAAASMKRGSDAPELPLKNAAGDAMEDSSESSSLIKETLLNPSLEEVTEIATENTEFLQLSQRKQTSDEETKKEQRYTPGPLPPTGMTLPNLKIHLNELIQQAEEEHNNNNSSTKSNSTNLSQLDDVGKIAVVSHTLSSYISTLEPRCQRKLATRIISDTSVWLSKLFRVFDSCAYFHEDGREGLVRLCRMLLHLKYPKFAVDGYEALYSRPPMVYISAASKPGLGQYLCNQLGLPLSSVNIVPCNTVFGCQYKMDTAALEKSIQEDLSAARTPLLVVASAGASVLGIVDNLQRLQDLCKANDLWLHVEGHSLAGLCLVSVSNLPARIGDSMTLPLGTWLGVPALPFITLYKAGEASYVHAAGLTSFNLHMRLNCLPVWATLLSLGSEGVVQRICHCFELSEHLVQKIEEIPRLRLIGKEWLKTKDGKMYTVADIISKSVSTSLLSEILVPVIVFQFTPVDKTSDTAIKIEDAPSAPTVKNPPYYDNLNSWLGQVLIRDIPSVHLDIIDLDQHGICLRFCPLESAHIHGTSKSDIDDFCVCLQQQVAILNATVTHKETFRKLLDKHRNLQLVEIANWAGLGGVRYISEQWVDRLTELTDTGKEEINRLNYEVVTKLRATDSAFSIGEGEDGMYCVRFGMVTEDLDVEELVSMVLMTGKEIEESSKFLETMSEMVRQGIEAAAKGLEQENEERIVSEGILRHVPLVGTFVNWWSPLPKETGIKGRSFNLTSGVVESTENIYKYHMQIQEGGSSLASPKTPPPAMQARITPGGSSSDHSRQSSHSSQAGGISPSTQVASAVSSKQE